MQIITRSVEDGTVAGPGLSALETLVTFFLLPTLLFAVIAGLSWIASAPRKQKYNSSITTID
ncbi:MAG: hypothetical protein O3A27_06130 [Actinomycetota bacterium]|nr:hypothetical protein [Actinomycetota bacterium]